VVISQKERRYKQVKLWEFVSTHWEDSSVPGWAPLWAQSAAPYMGVAVMHVRGHGMQLGTQRFTSLRADY
jgi:hypothetical protein